MSKKKRPPLNDLESILLRPESEWENEGGREPIDSGPPESSMPHNLSNKAISYLAQIQDLQDQLEQEYLKLQRLEMAIKGFSIALQEEIEKGH